MYVTYFDEIKANPENGQPKYIVGGLAVPMEKVSGLEGKLNALAEQTFGTTELRPDTEFHANHIYTGKGAFKGRDVDERIGVLKAIGEILSERDAFGRVYAAIDTDRLWNKNQAAEFAFAHFCERIQLFIGREQHTLMVGDLDDGEAKNMIRDFQRYRANGTPWQYGIEISSIVDSVHFGRSHHSRMIQLADVYLFLMTHRWGTRNGWFADKLTAALDDCDLSPQRYKEWPR